MRIHQVLCMSLVNLTEHPDKVVYGKITVQPMLYFRIYLNHSIYYFLTCWDQPFFLLREALNLDEMQPGLLPLEPSICHVPLHGKP